MDMDYRAAGFWLTLGQWAFNIVVLVWMAISRKHQANNKLVKELAESNARKIDEAKAKELILEHVPGCPNTIGLGEANAKLNALPSQQSIDQLNKNIGELKGRIDGLSRAVDLMNEFLINQGGKN